MIGESGTQQTIYKLRNKHFAILQNPGSLNMH